MRGFTLKHPNDWRRGDSSLCRDPWRPSDNNKTLTEQVYPQWWGENGEQNRNSNSFDDIDLKIENQRAKNDAVKETTYEPETDQRRSRSPLRKS